MKNALRSKKNKLYSCPLDKQMNYKKKELYGKEDEEHHTEKIQEEILVPNAQEKTSDVPQVEDEVILD